MECYSHRSILANRQPSWLLDSYWILTTQGSKTFVRNGNAPSKQMTIKYENENKSITMPTGKAFYAYLNGTKYPLGGGGNSTFSKNESGYYKTAEGFIIQWGKVHQNDDADGSATAHFPIAFPTKCLSFVATYYPSTNRKNTYWCLSTPPQKHQASMYCSKGDYYWIALGY